MARLRSVNNRSQRRPLLQLQTSCLHLKLGLLSNSCLHLQKYECQQYLISDRDNLFEHLQFSIQQRSLFKRQRESRGCSFHVFIVHTLRRQKTRRQVQVAAGAGRQGPGPARRGGARRPKQVVNPRFYLRLILMINTSCNQPAPAPRPRPARSLVEEVTQCGNILKCK